MIPFDSITRRRVLASLAMAWPALRSQGAQVASLASPPPAVALLTEAPADIDPSGYLVSEKLDGVRALWDGSELRFRSGRRIAAPAWCTEALPATALDGELWCGRGRFDIVSGAVRRNMPDEALWRSVRFMIFELPGAGGDFALRAALIADHVRKSSAQFLGAVDQSPVRDRASLRNRLAAVVRGGGEGPGVASRGCAVDAGERPVSAETQAAAGCRGAGALVRARTWAADGSDGCHSRAQ